jgi:hypothetical protein
MFENRELRRIFRPKRGDIHNKELHDLNFSPGIIRMIKSWRIRWMGQAARMGKSRTCIGYWWKSKRERYH